MALRAKNQITIPEKIMDQITDTSCFEVEFMDGAVGSSGLPVSSTQTPILKLLSAQRPAGLSATLPPAAPMKQLI